MKNSQRFIVDSCFFKELENLAPVGMNKNSFEQQTNYQLLIEILIKSNINIQFNCPEEVLYNSLIKDSELINWLVEKVPEHNPTRIYVTENSNAMLFLESDEYAPEDKMLNNIYLKDFSNDEKVRSNNFGVLALSPKDILCDTSLFSNNGDAMQKDSNSKWTFKEYNKCCNSLIFADLYILTRDKDDNLYPILDGLLPKNYTEEDFQLTIFTKPVTNTRIRKGDHDSIYNYRREARMYLRKEWKEINDWLKRSRPSYPISLIIYGCGSEDIHNRHIVTNYHLIDCGAGFDQVNRRDETVLTRNGNMSTYSASNRTFERATATHTTTYNIYFPHFNLARNEVIMKDYLNTLDEVMAVVKSNSIRVDKYSATGENTPVDELDALITNRLFRIIS